MPGFATTIVAIFQNLGGETRIVLGADGLQGTMDGQGHRGPWRDECKIAQIGPYYYAVAGPPYDPTHGYDAYRTLKRALSREGSFQEKANWFETTVLQEMNAITYWPSSLRAVGALVVNSAEFPEYYRAEILRDSLGQWEFGPRTGVRDQLPMNTRIVALGINDHIRMPPVELLARPIDAVKELISVEAKEHPGEVGGSISIVEFTQKGTRWIERGACQQ
jgi:hypothetical protein